MIKNKEYPIGLLSLVLVGGFCATSLYATEAESPQTPAAEVSPSTDLSDSTAPSQDSSVSALGALPETKKLDTIERAQGPSGRKLPTRLSLQERKQRKAEEDAARAADQAKALEEANAMPDQASEEGVAPPPPSRRPMGVGAGFNPFAGGGLKPGDVQLRPSRSRSAEPTASQAAQDDAARLRSSTQPSAAPAPQEGASVVPAPKPLAIQRASADSLLADAGKLDKANKDAVQRLLSRIDVFMNRASPEDKAKLQGTRDSLNDIVNPTAQRIIKK